MTEFSGLVCRWYGEGQDERLAALDHAMPALEFLSMDARQQQQVIPDCPICEAWSSKMLPVRDLISTCGDALPDDVQTHLERLWSACWALQALEMPCYDREIFEHGAWQSIRAAAHEALAVMDPASIKPLLTDFAPK